MNGPHRISPTVCKCGTPWALPCKCPENVLERFTNDRTSRCFYFEELKRWVVAEFGSADESTIQKALNIEDIVQSVLNLDGVVELGDGAYQSPFEL